MSDYASIIESDECPTPIQWNTYRRCIAARIVQLETELAEARSLMNRNYNAMVDAATSYPGIHGESFSEVEAIGWYEDQLSAYKEAVRVLAEPCRMALDDNPDHDRDFIVWKIIQITNPIAKAAIEGSHHDQG